MIDTIVKLVPLYLAPVLALTSTLLTLFVYLSPAAMLHTQVALMTISPGRTIPLPNDVKDSVDGPTIFMGMLGALWLNIPSQVSYRNIGSCARKNNGAHVNCTAVSTSPIWGEYDTRPSSIPLMPFSLDLSALPQSVPTFMTGPTATTPAWVAVALVFWGLFLIIFSLSTIHEKLGPKLSNLLGKPAVARSAAWVGVLGYMIGEYLCILFKPWSLYST